MFGLCETARLYRRAGQKGGKPAYAEQAVEFACRSQPIASARPGGDAVSRSGDTLIFARGVEISSGDRIALDGKVYAAAEVRTLRGLGGGIHHLEIVLRAE